MANIEDTTNPPRRWATVAPSPSRRSLLSFLTATAAIVPVVTGTSFPAKAASTAQEAPEVLAIGQQLTALREAHKTAVVRKTEAAALYERTRPPLPEELIEPRADRFLVKDVAGEEHDIDGLALWNGDAPPRWIYGARDLQIYIIRHDISRRTKEGKRLRKLARMAKKYETETQAALLASGYDDRDRDTCSLIAKIDGLAGKLLRLQPCTVDGLLVYASASMAIKECFGEGDVRGMGFAQGLGNQLAEALIRLELREARS